MELKKGHLVPSLADALLAADHTLAGRGIQVDTARDNRIALNMFSPGVRRSASDEHAAEDLFADEGHSLDAMEVDAGTVFSRTPQAAVRHGENYDDSVLDRGAPTGDSTPGRRSADAQDDASMLSAPTDQNRVEDPMSDDEENVVDQKVLLPLSYGPAKWAYLCRAG